MLTGCRASIPDVGAMDQYTGFMRNAVWWWASWPRADPWHRRSGSLFALAVLCSDLIRKFGEWRAGATIIMR